MRILVLYYSMTGNVYRMAKLVAEGAREAGAEVDVKTVPELIPDKVIQGDESLRKAREEQADVPIAEPEQLADYDGFIVGTPTRFGNMAAQMCNLWDRTGALWMEGALIGKPVGIFCSSASMHGGQETTLLSMVAPLVHLGMIYVGVPYSVRELLTTTGGGSPYGPGHVAGGEGKRPVDAEEAAICRALGRRLADVATRLQGMKDEG